MRPGHARPGGQTIPSTLCENEYHFPVKRKLGTAHDDALVKYFSVWKCVLTSVPGQEDTFSAIVRSHELEFFVLRHGRHG
jgi:hypothetical protein